MDQDYAEIRQRITNRYNNRAEFYSHLVAFLVSNGILWVLVSPSGTWFTIAAIAMGLWFMGLVIHFIQYLMKETKERAIEHAIEREQAWRRGSDEIPERDIKRKRDRLKLSPDGELMEIVDDEALRAKRR